MPVRLITPIAIALFLASACAPTNTNRAPKANLSPQQRADAANAKAGKNSGNDTATTDATTDPKKQKTVTAIAKCRLTDSAKLTDAQVQTEEFCDAIAVTLGTDGALHLQGLTLQDNAGAAVALSASNEAAGSNAADGRRTFTFVSNTTSPKTKDGKSNLLQLGFLLPDQANKIDMTKLTVSIAMAGATAATTVPSEDNTNHDSSLVFSTAKSSNGQPIVNLLMGSIDATAAVGAANAPISNISFVVTISYVVKLPSQ